MESLQTKKSVNVASTVNINNEAENNLISKKMETLQTIKKSVNVASTININNEAENNLINKKMKATITERTRAKCIDIFYQGLVNKYKNSSPTTRYRYISKTTERELRTQSIERTDHWIEAVKSKNKTNLKTLLYNSCPFRYDLRLDPHKNVFQYLTKIILSDDLKARRLQLKAYLSNNKLQKEKAELIVNQLQTAKELKQEAQRHILNFIHNKKMTKEKYKDYLSEKQKIKDERKSKKMWAKHFAIQQPA